MTSEDRQLGRHDVGAAALRGTGISLDQLRARYALPAYPWPLMVPVDGWRVVAEDRAVLALAAPHGDRWGLIELRKQEDGFHWWTAQGGVPMLPSRAARRGGLRLHWPADPVIAAAGQRLKLQIVLSNDGPTIWTNREIVPGVGRDELIVFASIHDESGAPLRTGRQVVLLGAGPLVHFQPGESMTQDVMLPRGVEKLSPGDYGLTAQWTDLALDAAPGRLRLVGEHLNAAAENDA